MGSLVSSLFLQAFFWDRKVVASNLFFIWSLCLQKVWCLSDVKIFPTIFIRIRLS